MERGWGGPNEYRELVQFAYITVDVKRLNEENYFFSLKPDQILVKPTINEVLSDYFETLTGITNEDVINKGVSMNDAREYIEQAIKGGMWCSWGPDLDVINEDMARNGIDSLTINAYLDYRRLLRYSNIRTEAVTSGTFLEEMNQPELSFLLKNHPELLGENGYKAHNAVHDVMSLACGLLGIAENTDILNQRDLLVNAKRY